MHAIKAVYNGSSFMPKQPIPIQGYYEVVITFIEPIEERIMDKQARIDWLNKIERELELSEDEDELLSNFPKQGLMKMSYKDWLD